MPCWPRGPEPVVWPLEHSECFLTKDSSDNRSPPMVWGRAWAVRLLTESVHPPPVLFLPDTEFRTPAPRRMRKAVAAASCCRQVVPTSS